MIVIHNTDNKITVKSSFIIKFNRRYRFLKTVRVVMSCVVLLLHIDLINTFIFIKSKNRLRRFLTCFLILINPLQLIKKLISNDSYQQLPF